MTKGNLIATSFVGAIPAGFLAYFTIMAFINYAENMATMLQVVTGTTVLFSVLMALSPIAILLFSKGKPKEGTEVVAAGSATAAVAASKSAAAEPDVAELDEPQEEEFGESDSAGTDDEDMSLSGFTEFSGEESSAASDDAFEFDDDGFEFEDDEFK